MSELGDETFIIAAILAMRFSRSVVFAGAISALALMTVLSTLLGMVAPQLISQQVVNRLAVVLYLCFGFRLLYIAAMAGKDGDGALAREMEEKEGALDSDGAAGKGARRRGVRAMLGRCFSAVFLEAFILIFVAEWGDRSQITTIALAAHMNALGVTLGAIAGHVVTTGLAVVGGHIAAKRISQRAVAASGGLLFFLFAISAAVYGT